jgi:transposase
LRAKRAELEQALCGALQPHHAFMIAQHLAHLDFLEEQIAAFDVQIETMIEASGLPPAAPPATLGGQTDGTDLVEPQAADPSTTPSGWAAARMICDAVPGIGSRVAETIVAELGTDMSRFPNAGHAASWAGLVPGQHESAGKRRSTRIRKGNRYLKAALIQAAHGANKVKESYLAAFYRRVAVRRGKKKAIVALAHKILVIVYRLLKTGEVYQERGVAALDEHQKDRLLQRLQRRIAQLGYSVSLEPMDAVAA